MERSSRTAIRGIGVISLVLTLVSAYFLFQRTAALSTLQNPATLKLLLEMAMIVLLLAAIFRYTEKSRKPLRTAGQSCTATGQGCEAAWQKCASGNLRYALCGLVVLGYLWLHQILVPILAAGLYLGYLILLGLTVSDLLNRRCRPCGGIASAVAGTDPGTVPAFFKTSRALLLGASIQLIIMAVFSAAGISGTGFFRLQCLLVFLPVLGWHVYKRIKQHDFAARRNDSAALRKDLLYLLPAMLIAGLLLQAGRMNIALDYDSLHYSLRSAFVLDNGAGIYQNLGFVNDVYVYPKGLETLCLPLSGLASGAFVTAVSWWLTAGSLWAVYMIVAGERFHRSMAPEKLICLEKTLSVKPEKAPEKARNKLYEKHLEINCTKGSGRELSLAGLCAAVCVCAVPGIMNMAASAKTDAATLFFQLLCIAELVEAFRVENRTSQMNGLAAAIFTLILKPTSYLFSLLPVVAALVIFLVNRKKNSENDPGQAHKPGAAAVLILIASVLAYLLITLRTVLIAGVPVTTAGGGLWKLLGFELKYPFAGLNAAGEQSQSLLKRLIGVFACPVGEDMAHVYIAWGGLIPALCILAAVIRAALRKKSQQENHESKVDISLTRTESDPTQPGTGTILADTFQTHPDAGARYLYLSLGLTLVASIGCINALYQVDGNYFMLLYALAVICAFRRSGAALRLLKALAPALALGALMCCITNWAGVPGLSEPKLIHRGYVNQIELDRAAQQAQGTGELYELLESDPTTRVLAMSEQPACFVYRCNVQSYTDLEGSGGNVYLVKTLALFKEYLDHAKEDCILTDDAFLAGHTRAADIVGYMLEDGSLTPLWEGAGKHLYKYESGR